MTNQIKANILVSASIGDSIGSMVGGLVGACANKDVACLIHKKYKGLRKPTTNLSIFDGCTCHVYWAYKTNLEKED